MELIKRLGLTVGFSICLVLPSMAQIYKYLAAPGLAIYLLGVPTVIFLMQAPFFWKFSQSIDRQKSLLIFMILFGIVIVLFYFLYPLADQGIVGGGSDRDDNLKIALSRLVEGKYPYYAKTYLGNSLTIFPGLVLMAAPFFFLGATASGNLFWLLALYLFFMRKFDSIPALPLLLVGILLLLSPVFLIELMTGGTLSSNAIMVLILTLSLFDRAKSGRVSFGTYLCAGGLGVVLSSRLNFLFILPILFFGIKQSVGFKQTLRLMLAVLAGFLSVTLPFYLYDPAGFSPLENSNQFFWMNAVWPHATFWMPILSVLFSWGVAFWPWPMKDWTSLLFRCALTQLFPVLILILTLSLVRPIHWDLFEYGLLYIFFLTPAFLTSLQFTRTGRCPD